MKPLPPRAPRFSIPVSGARLGSAVRPSQDGPDTLLQNIESQRRGERRGVSQEEAAPAIPEVENAYANVPLGQAAYGLPEESSAASAPLRFNISGTRLGSGLTPLRFKSPTLGLRTNASRLPLSTSEDEVA